MEIGISNNLNNLSASLSGAFKSESTGVNAFGIGNANKPEVELSAQARILQQNEQTQNERRESVNAGNQAEESADVTGNEFIRVSSSVGSAARNNLTSEKATEVYRSIQDLL
ncbi:hypothetical protein [Aliiglaciecola lipolytica]|uniref:Uncharacterized protein n=1 Tax=Aliiglaciecola lipolytica E3 TaxID=1127673 RepID=K6X8H7_9ALTE|nr:hypothetical protein [Aliiglaciecola lipolytica]GAC16919.1 hypothetical protein GLIP_4308 [Aliiglaciecola lipolytica E3]